jgi:hypothetical protein
MARAGQRTRQSIATDSFGFAWSPLGRSWLSTIFELIHQSATNQPDHEAAGRTAVVNDSASRDGTELFPIALFNAKAMMLMSAYSLLL